MTYLRPHNHARTRRNRIIAAIFIVIAVVVGLIQFSAPHVFPAFGNALARPFWRERFAFESGAFRTPEELLAENESLKRQLSDLQLQYADSSVAMADADYQSLLSSLGRATTSPKQLILAAVLARPAFLPQDGLILDIGEADGISTTSLVYSPERVLLGRIGQLLAHSAKVALYSSPGESYSVLIGGKRVPATAYGRGGGQYRAEVPHGSGVAIGDPVSDGALYDRPFGVVVSILTDPSDPFDTVLFAPPVNIYKLRFVLVHK